MLATVLSLDSRYPLEDATDSKGQDAFRYVVNGRSPLEWLVERYYRKLDKASGIIDDPNLWSDDPKYIFNLIPRLVSVALRTNELVALLPQG